MNNISDGIYILTQNDLSAREAAAFKRGVARGRFEASIESQADGGRKQKRPPYGSEIVGVQDGR